MIYFLFVSDTSFRKSSEKQRGNVAARKRWAKEPSNTVLKVFRNADIISSGDTATAQGSDSTKGAFLFTLFAFFQPFNLFLSFTLLLLHN